MLASLGSVFDVPDPWSFISPPPGSTTKKSVSSGEPAKKKARMSSGASGEWWQCDACLKSAPAKGKEAFCAEHASGLLGAEEGRKAMQAQLKTAKAHLKKAQDNVKRLEEALKESGGGGGSGAGVPTLVITQCGFDYDYCDGPDSISEGDVPVALALKHPLPVGGRERLCEALLGNSLHLTFCKDQRLRGRFALPADIEACLAPIPDGRKEMRPGAVMYHPATGELTVYMRKSASGKERAGCKLFGYLLKDGMSVLSFKHTAGCSLCRKGGYVSLDFEKVRFQDEEVQDDDKADSSDIW